MIKPSRLQASSLRSVAIGVGLLIVWQTIVWITGVPHFILPSPLDVLVSAYENAELLLEHASITLAEILLGLVLGCAFGLSSALTLQWFKPLRPWLLPVLVVSQAIPGFALAPVLMMWLGYGMASKVAMAMLIIYFPVTAACYDGLRHTPRAWLELGRTMNASRLSMLWHIRIPAALPVLASGLRVAAAAAPIGAIVGEWVGSSGGLGYLMLRTNARMQVDLMFAALLVLSVMAVVLYFSVDKALNRWVSWHVPPH